MVRATLSVLLALSAVFLWWWGGRERELAAAHRALLTFQFEEARRRFTALEEVGILDRLLRPLWPDRHRSAAGLAVADYWNGKAPSPAPAGRAKTTASDGAHEDDGIASRFLAANAAYRQATASGGDWRTMTARLGEVIERYAHILRDDPGHRDAAFNYEFVVRYRAAIAARQRDLPPSGGDAPNVTIHGLEGTPPPGSGRNFRMLVPMQPDERREAEEAGRGGRRVRKG